MAEAANNEFDLLAFLERRVPVDPALRAPQRRDSMSFPESDEQFARRVARYERYMATGEFL